MASSSNENGNLMDEFEESFKTCLNAMTKQESNNGVSKEELELEVQKTASKFIDIARQMEAFFLQKRFLVCSLKPDMLIKDENQELKHEIARKEFLLNKHYTRLEEWKLHLSDLQQAPGYNKSGTGPADIRQSNSIGFSANSMSAGSSTGHQIGMTNTLQNQLNQQHIHQQQQMMQAQQMQQMQSYGKFNKSMK